MNTYFVTTLLTCILLINTDETKSQHSSVKEIEDAITNQWQSIESLYIEEEEYIADNEAIPKEGSYISLFTFAMSNGNKRASSFASVGPDGKKTIQSETREDGKNLYQITRQPDDPSKIAYVAIDKQKTGNEFYQGIKMALHWLLMPTGKHLSILLRQGAKISLDSQNGNAVVDYSMSRGTLKCRLSEKFDWAIEEVILQTSNNSQTLYRVDEFQRIKGRYFPLKGTIVSTNHNKSNERKFRVKKVQINDSLSSSMFDISNLPNGTIVYDLNNFRDYTVGGNKVAKYVKPERLDVATGTYIQDQSQEVRVPDEPSSKTPMIIGGVGISLIAIAAITAYRRR